MSRTPLALFFISGALIGLVYLAIFWSLIRKKDRWKLLAAWTLAPLFGWAVRAPFIFVNLRFGLVVYRAESVVELALFGAGIGLAGTAATLWFLRAKWRDAEAAAH